MKNIFLVLGLWALLPSLYGQNLLFLDGVQLTTDNTTTFCIEGGILLKNESQIRNEGTLNLGSSGSGFTPSEANWVNNNNAEPGQDANASGHVRLLLNGARITGTLPLPVASNFNHLWLDAANGVNWMDTKVEVSDGLHLGNSVLEVNNRTLTIEQISPSAIDASGGGALRLESVPPLPGPDQLSLIQWRTDPNPQIYSMPLRSATGADYMFSFSTLSSAAPEFVGLSSYGTGSNNLPLPESFFSNPPVDNTDLDGNSSDDSDNIVDRFWMINSPNKAIANLEFQIPTSEATTGNLTTTTPLNAFYFDGDWNFPGAGSGDALTGVNVAVNNTMIRTYALGNLAVNLPIECISFAGMQDGHKVKLEWQTASETNNAGFEIQRSIDGISFEQIAFLEGRGTTSNASWYKYIDETTFPGREYYYRIVQQDYNGNRQFVCGIVSIELDIYFEDGILSVAPNPAFNKTTVFVPEEFIGSMLALSTIQGKILREIRLTSAKFNLVRNELPSGIYFLNIKSNNRANFTKPVKLIFID